jgi:hypothetical protein
VLAFNLVADDDEDLNRDAALLLPRLEVAAHGCRPAVSRARPPSSGSSLRTPSRSTRFWGLPRRRADRRPGLCRSASTPASRQPGRAVDATAVERRPGARGHRDGRRPAGRRRRDSAADSARCCASGPTIPARIVGSGIGSRADGPPPPLRYRSVPNRARRATNPNLLSSSVTCGSGRVKMAARADARISFRRPQ